MDELHRDVSRRRFLGLAGSAALATVLAACGVSARSAAPSATGSITPSPSPTPPPPASPTSSPVGLGLRDQIARMLLVGFRGTTPEEASATLADIRERSLGGVLLFDIDVPTGARVRNIVSPGQLRELTDALRAAAGDRGLIIAVDQEGGHVARLGPDRGFPATISAADLGSRADLDYTRAAAVELAGTLVDAGIDLNLAPVVDLNLNPANPIIGALGRSFGPDPELVVAQAEAFISGHRAVGVRTALKHFPGHGSAAADTHLGVVDVTGLWREVELEPFRRIIADGLCDSVLTAHVFNAQLDAARPATLSAPIVTGMLRDRLGWDGVVISDDLQMGAIRQQFGYDKAVALALEAGVDLLTIANQQVFEEGIVSRTVDLVEELVRSGRIGEDRIAASVARLDRFVNGRR